MIGKDSVEADIESNHYNTNSTTFQYTVPTTASGKINFGVVGFGTANVFDTLTITVGSAIVLPIALTQFIGKAIDNMNVLQWQTVSEKNTSHFEIERSFDAQTWSTLGKIKAVGNSQTFQNYEFTDEKPSIQNYYRLKIVDMDQHTEYSKVISLTNAKDYELIVFPTPTKQQITLRYSSATPEIGKVRIYDIVGKLRYATELEVLHTTNEYLLDISNLSSGVYLLQFDVVGKQLISKIVKE
jgi:hypothetical protein